MRTLLMLLCSLIAALPLAAEVIWSEPRDFYVDPPEGWTFIEDPTPEHFVMTDAKHRLVLEIFSQPKGQVTDLAAKAADLRAKLRAQGPEESFVWNQRPAWLGDLTFQAGPTQARGWALVADDGDGWVSALAYSPVSDYDQASDVLISALNSLALGLESRREPGPLSTFFQATAGQPRADRQSLAGLEPPLVLTYNLDLDEAIQATLERETRILMTQLGKQVKDQRVLAPGWTRFYRQVYRDLYASLKPVAAYWQARVDQKALAAADLPARILAWLQAFTYDRKGGLTDVSTPWQTLKTHAGDCDSRALVYLALMEHLGIGGILMVSAPYSHGMAALDWPGAGARFPFEGKGWLVAELTDVVNLGQIAADKADPSQWIGVDLWGKP